MAPWQNATKHGSMQSQCIATFAWSNYRRKINMLALLLANHRKEEAYMQYINAKALLPDALVKELQSYMQGGYIYVPIDQAQKKQWGEVSGYRKELQQRNRQIKEAYRGGTSMNDLAEKYRLSVYAIRKIIYQK